MPGTKEIRMKIRSVQNTRKITKAMEMVAASKMRQGPGAHAARAALRRENPQRLAAHISHANPEYRHPFLVDRDSVKRVGIIVITTDKGLCGALNTNLLRLVLAQYKEWQAQAEEIEVCAIGNKGFGFMQRLGAKLSSHIVQLGDRPQMDKLIGAVKVNARRLYQRPLRPPDARLHALRQYDEAGAGHRAVCCRFPASGWGHRKRCGITSTSLKRAPVLDQVMTR